jgi:hypothetical protein
VMGAETRGGLGERTHAEGGGKRRGGRRETETETKRQRKRERETGQEGCKEREIYL